MDTYTVKDLKKIIMNYKKSNCPAVSRARRDELLTIIKDLNISTDGKKGKTDSCVKCKIKMNLPKTDKIDLKKYENMEEFPKRKLIGGDDLIGFTENTTKFLEKIEELYKDGYDNLKVSLESIRKENKKNKTFLNIDDYFEEELKKPLFFNKSFFKKFVKKEGMEYAKSIIMTLFKRVNNKFLTNQIKIPSQEIKPDGKGKTINVGKGIDGGVFVSSFGKVSYKNNKKDK
jgi:hypothetical protein